MAALRPEQALTYLRALSSDVRAVAVREAGGGLLAGNPELDAPECLVERDGDLEIVQRLGPCALEALARHDARVALGALRPPQTP